MKPFRRSRRGAGFSLIEVLVTMAVSAVALLGLAGMQLQGARMQTVAGYRGTAALLASNLADRIRANEKAGKTLTAYVFTNAYKTTAPVDADCSADCTPTQIAEHDLHSWWIHDASAQLPDPWVYVSASDGAYHITVMWREPDQEAGTRNGTADAFTCPAPAVSGAATDVSIEGVRCYTIMVWP